MKQLILLLLKMMTIFGFSSYLHAKIPSKTPTEQYILLVDLALQKDFIGNDKLFKIKESADKKEFLNPISEVMSSKSSILLLYQKTFNRVKNKDLNFDKISSWMTQTLINREDERV